MKKHPEFQHRGRKRRLRPFTWFKLSFLAICLLAAGSLYTPYPLKLARVLRAMQKAHYKQTAPKPAETPKPEPKPEPQPQPEPQPEPPAPPAEPVVVPWSPAEHFAMPRLELPPFPPALPERVSDGKFAHLNELVNGINNKSTVNFKPGSTASQDRTKKDAYMLHVAVELIQPRAADGKELLLANPELPKVLPGYEEMMATARVSPWFNALYLHKQNRIRKNASQVDKLLDRHNFYDTDTMLELESAQTGRKLLWLQADMDVVSDGSDGDRLPTMPKKILESSHYQPSTSYRWKKLGDTPNPLLPGWQGRLKKLQKEKGDPAAIEHARLTIADIKKYSFLLAEYDPFVVAPLVFKEGKERGFAPVPGDYAVVIVGNRVFPAIVGDYGPNFKTGEASLRLCKEVNPKATVYARAVSNLGVSYLYFPGSKEEVNGPIDYARLHTRCRELLEEFGGLGAEAQFVEFEDLLAPQAPAQPSAQPSPQSSPQS